VGLSDQDQINKYLVENKMNWGFIDETSTLIGSFVQTIPIPTKSSVVYHVTWTKTVEEKVTRINEVVEAYKKL
jgi:hypothetical protein